jgi:hypothetical protein
MSTFVKSLILGVFLVMVLWGCSSSTDPMNEATAIIKFTPDNVNVTVGSETIVTIEFTELTIPIFGLSFQLTYDSTYVSFSDTLKIESGGLLGNQAITFTRISETMIYLTITRVQGQESVGGAGVICTLPFMARAVGISTIELLDGAVHLFDSAGDEIDNSGLETGGVSVSVR